MTIEEIKTKIRNDFRALAFLSDNIKSDYEILIELAEWAAKEKIYISWCYIQEYGGRNKDLMLKLISINSNAISGVHPDLWKSAHFLKMAYRRANKSIMVPFVDFYWKDEKYCTYSWKALVPKEVRLTSMWEKLNAGVIV